jgi:hypothetical protein
MALAPNQDFNLLFNKASYSKMFLDTAVAISYTNIATGGNLKTFTTVAFDSTANANGKAIANTDTLLTSIVPDSEYRIIRYLSAKNSSATNKVWSDVALNTSVVAATPAYKSIIDDYVIKQSGASAGQIPVAEYVTTGTTPLLDTIKISSIITTLKTDKLLLKDTDIYDANGQTTSLIGLYKLKEDGSITTAQQIILTELENRNLKFFSAFLVEYWFYSCRYRLLLKEFFTVYSSATNSYTNSDLGFSTSVNKSTYLSKLTDLLAQLNMRMGHMISIVNAINTDYSTIITSIERTINSGAGTPGSNKALEKTFANLQNSYIESDTYLSEKNFSKEVMEYNSEKNRYSNILLGLYAFLNIAALATVFHLASN